MIFVCGFPYVNRFYGSIRRVACTKGRLVNCIFTQKPNCRTGCVYTVQQTIALLTDISDFRIVSANRIISIVHSCYWFVNTRITR